MEQLKDFDFAVSFEHGSLSDMALQAFRPETRGKRPNVNPVERHVDFGWGEPTDVSGMVQSFRPEVAALQRRRAARMGEPLPMPETQA